MIAVGTKVKLVKDVENYPTIYAKAGLTGTLVRVDDEGAYWVKLDRHFPELSEWENELQIWDWSDYADNGPDAKPETYLEAVS